VQYINLSSLNATSFLFNSIIVFYVLEVASSAGFIPDVSFACHVGYFLVCFKKSKFA
jgi:hypothetical protein